MARGSPRFLAVLLATSLVASFLFGFRPAVRSLERGLDVSYIYAANHASAQGLAWGRDFVSTYGPYPYFINAADVESIRPKKVVAELFLVILAGAACALFAGIGPAAGRFRLALYAVLLTYGVHVQDDEEQWFFVVVLLLLLSLRGPRLLGLWIFSVASALAGLFVLVKASLGIGSLLALAAGCLVFFRPREVASRLGLLGLGAGLGFGVGWLVHHGTLAGIGDYASTLAPVVSGYSSAMSMAPENWELAPLSFGAFAVILGAWGFALRSRGAAVTLLACAVPLFVAWKHAMVRQDVWHLRIFVLAGLFVVILLLRETLDRRWEAGPLLVAAILPPLLTPWFVSWETRADGVRVMTRMLGAPFRFHALWPARPTASGLEALSLPADLRDRIGGSSVDVYPWESVYVAANDFAWRNRPSPASFATYTPELDGMNARFFRSPQRPRYVLWHREPGIHSVEGRHLFWDEPETLRSLLSSYGLVATRRAFLLEELAEPRLSQPKPLRIVESRWGDWIPVPEADGVLLAAVDFERPRWASVRKLLFREDPMFVSIEFEGRQVTRFRFVPDQARSGLWMSPLPRDVDELRSVLRGRFSGLRPKAIRLHGAWASRELGTFVVTWLRMADLAHEEH